MPNFLGRVISPILAPFGVLYNPLTTGVRSVREALYRPPQLTIDSIDQSTWPNPLQPVSPIAPPGAEPLSFPFNLGQNIQYTPRGDSEYSAAQLRSLARYPLARVCIENNKDILAKMPHRIQLRPLPGETNKERAARGKGDKTLLSLNRFFDNPNPEQNWEEFVRPLLEDMLVIDGATIFLGREKGDTKGKITQLRWVEGGGVTRLIDEHGWTPMPPYPAYQLLWEGYPRIEATTDQILYAVRNICYRNTPSSALYGMCYDDQTEVLTRRGWLKFNDVKIEDLIATRNFDTKKFEWQLPTHLVDNEYSGDMYRCYSKNVDLLVTPQHRMLVSRMGNTCRDPRNEHIQTIEELATSTVRGKRHNSEVRIPMTSIWEGTSIGVKVFSTDKSFVNKVIKPSNGVFTFKAGDANKDVEISFEGDQAVCAKILEKVKTSDKPVVMSGDEYCAFMGAYLSEGWSDKYCVYVCQNQESKGFVPYQELLKGILGRKPYHNPNKEFVISRKVLSDFVKKFGKAHEKFIPEDIMNADKRQIEIFWKYYMLGDGNTETLASVSGRGLGPRKRESLSTCSKRLAGQLVELAQKLGWSASTHTIPAQKQKFSKDSTKLSDCREQYEVNIRYSESMSFNIEKTKYEGHIYCVTVPNGIIYVRRNGKPLWCGNSPVEQVAKEIEIGWERLQYIYDYYATGTTPGTIIFAPVNTPADKIREAQQFLDSNLAGDLQKRRQIQILQGFQDIGKSEQVHDFKEPTLADLYDEVHTRRICFAFGTSPQRLLRQMNRASAGAMQEAAEEEGTMPFLSWLKYTMDKVIQLKMGYTDYEFAFDPFVETDVKKLAEADEIDVKNGLYTRNEKRKERGDDPIDEPLADELVVTTSSGVVPLNMASELAQMAIRSKATGGVGGGGAKLRTTAQGTSKSIGSELEKLFSQSVNGKGHCTNHTSFSNGCADCNAHEFITRLEVLYQEAQE